MMEASVKVGAFGEETAVEYLKWDRNMLISKISNL